MKGQLRRFKGEGQRCKFYPNNEAHYKHVYSTFLMPYKRMKALRNLDNSFHPKKEFIIPGLMTADLEL